jgi:hypothetical protein
MVVSLIMANRLNGTEVSAHRQRRYAATPATTSRDSTITPNPFTIGAKRNPYSNGTARSATAAS